MAAPAASAASPIQMFAALGHTVFTTAGSDEKCALCEASAPARAINYRTEDFVAVIKEETGGKGVDVILDMVGGDYVQRNIERPRHLGPHRQYRLSERRQGRAWISGPLLTQAADPGRHHLAGADHRRETAPSAMPLLREVWPLVADWPDPPGGGPASFRLAEAQEAHEYHGKNRPYRQNPAGSLTPRRQCCAGGGEILCASIGGVG